MMHVLQVVRPMDGGMKKHVLSLLAHLDQSKYQIILAAPDKEDWDEILAGSNVEVVYLPLQGNLALCSDLAGMRRLGHLIQRRKIHLVHTHGMKAGLVGRMAGLISGGLNPQSRPYFLATVHNSIYQYPMSKTKRWAIGQAQSFLGRYTDGFIAVSQGLKRELMTWEGIPEAKISVIYNGINPADFPHYPRPALPEAKIRLGLNPELPVVGMVARCAPQKGGEFFLGAASELSRLLNEVQFLVAGDGPLRLAWEQKARALGLRGKVHFIGHHPRPGELYPLLDVYVLPSLSEGLPLGVMEAMAAQRPILATWAGGIPELIQHRKTGLLVPPGNSSALTQGMMELLTRKTWAKKLGKAAGQAARDQFSEKEMVRQTEDLYQEIGDRIRHEDEVRSKGRWARA
ncbi:glycosyltransferase family 4 protein [Dehalobacterium formicoaceticum]|uniref:Glycosyltransferase family 4 protein n=1 Tax=Dehalobacterium formicoaceticum TaxID=51515 RepID=A0ABT1Y7K3_9FIRM|nr:glycosyltransferase family 4 protein [Dehalobacterium formicoaceticum]MCR6546466.1 glycosyltransferase family 4 protein [Dehalobacterium formicoaceticum]